MTALSLKLHSYRYFRYERAFAKREAEAVLGVPARLTSGEMQVETTRPAWAKLERLTYVSEASDGRTTRRTIQARLEQSSGNGHRQNTRYSAHGLHDYRGKFNPQLVRAIGNIIGLVPGASLLDPFCGSGTTLLESAHAGWNACGLDINPLGAMISGAKVRVMHSHSSVLEESRARLVSTVDKAARGLDFAHGFGRSDMERLSRSLDALPNLEYLSSWFPQSVLAQCAVILDAIERDTPEELRDFYRLILSNLAREFSHQEPADLRIRRRKEPLENGPLLSRFAANADARVRSVLAAKAVTGSLESIQSAFRADARRPLDWLPEYNGHRSFDAVITSPPYVTALPYIDTQRLSLCLLNLVASEDIMALQRRLTGTREITESTRREEESRIASGDDAPSSTVLALSRRMLKLAAGRDNGFRRRNMPALTNMYFRDMASVFGNVANVTRRGARFAFVVGPSSTTLGGVLVPIDTPTLLGHVARRSGWRPLQRLRMDAYQRYALHSQNSIRSEAVVVLERE